MRTLFNAVLGILLITGVCFAGETPAMDTADRINYSLGHQIGGDLKQQGLDITPEAVLSGIKDALAGADPQLSPEEMGSLLQELKKKIVAKQRGALQQERLKVKEQYRGEGREFLAQNAGKEGVVTLPSGLQYRVIKNGTGKSPGPHDRVKVNYRGTLLNGVEFDSSDREKQPTEFRVDGVIAGWTEALQLMKEGAKWQLFIPADLAFGERGPLADHTVIYDIELFSVVPGE